MSYIWKIHSIERTAGADQPGQGQAFGQMTDQSMPVNADSVRDITSQSIFARTGRLDFTSVDVSFTTLQADMPISLLGTEGECMDGDAVYHLYVAKWGCNGPLAGNVHRRYSINRGIAYIDSLSCNHRGDLEVSGMLMATYDGTNNPVVMTPDVLLPTDSQLNKGNERWTLHNEIGTVLNSEPVKGKRSINIDMGVSTSTQGRDSDPFDFLAMIDSILPVVTVEGIDLEWFDGLKLGLELQGAPVTHEDTIIMFRKRDGAGGFVADNVAEHIEVKANGAAYYSNLGRGGATEPALMEYRVECTSFLKEDPPSTFTEIAPILMRTSVVNSIS